MRVSWIFPCTLLEHPQMVQMMLNWIRKEEEGQMGGSMIHMYR